MEIISSSKVTSSVPLQERIILGSTFLADRSGNIVFDPVINEQIQIVTKVQNAQDFGQSFVYIVQIKDDTNTVVQLSWIQGQLAPLQELELSKSWTPALSGDYTVETFVWNSLTDSIPLSDKVANTYFVQ